MTDPTFFNLSAITQRIQQILQPAIGKIFWVKAEISSGRLRGGSFYCDLVETNGRGQILAQMRCMIWSRNLTRIRQKFKDCDLGLNLDDGTLVGLQCALQFSPKFGLSLNATDADPAFALGELELKKKQIIDRLSKDGLFQPNKELLVPALPLHIGLVTSADSAAYNDVVKTLSLSGYGFKIHLADATVQGERTEASVLCALSVLEQIELDLVVIARGGGSKTDLFYLDNEAIARKIASCKHPVWTGIGHETDTSVLDYVAHSSFKTPTAVAEEIVNRFKEMAVHLEEALNRFRTTWRYRTERESRFLTEAAIGIRQGTRKLLDTRQATLAGKAGQLSLRVSNRLSGEKAQLAVSKKTLTSACITSIQHARRHTAQWQERIQMLSRWLLKKRLDNLNALTLRFRQDRFVLQLNRSVETIKEMKTRLLRMVHQCLEVCEQDQSNFIKRFQLANVIKQIAVEQNALQVKMSTIKAYDPQNSLKRGFSLVYDQAGRLIKSVQDVNSGQTTRTTLYDGHLIGTIERIKGK